MGISLLVTNWRHIFKMKVFAITILIVGAFAEPEAKPDADADAYYYGNYGYNGASSLGYAVHPVVSSYGGYGLGSGAVGYAAHPYFSSYGSYGLRSFGKRSAEADPEAKAEAEADAYYNGNYGYHGVHSLGYSVRPYVSSNGHASSTYSGYGAVGYTAHPCGGYGLRSFGKRSADAGPEAEADAYYYGNYGCNGYAARPLISSNGYDARPHTSSNGYAQQTYGGNGALGYSARPYSGFSYGAFPSYG